MTVTINREMIAQLIIILAVCVGGWLMMVDPQVRAIGELERTIAEARAAALPANQSSLQAAAAEVAGYRKSLSVIETRNTMAGESSQLYSLIMGLAADHDVIVHHVQPGGDADHRGERPVLVERIEMTVEGTYSSVAEFVDAVVRLEGFLRSRMLQVSAVEREGEARVTARFVCEALHFSVASLSGQEEGLDHDQP